MAKKCIISGKKTRSGNNVSHSNRKTRRTFVPNLQKVSLFSESLGTNVNLRLTTNGLRTVEKNGGLDAYLLGKPSSKLTLEAKKLRVRIEKARASKGL